MRFSKDIDQPLYPSVPWQLDAFLVYPLVLLAVLAGYLNRDLIQVLLTWLQS